MNTQSPKALFDRGYQYHRQGDWESAWHCYQQGLVAAPDSIPLLSNTGFVCLMLGRYEEAAGYQQRVLALDPTLTGEWQKLGSAYKEMLRLPDAADCYLHILEVQPDDVDALHGLGIIRLLQGHASEAEEILRRALKTSPGSLAVRSCLLLTQNYKSSDPDELYREHLEWDRSSPWHPEPWQGAAVNAGRPVRVGYVSPDFCSHPVALFIEPLLSRHDKSAFEVYCYSDVSRPDAITGHLRGLASVWRDVRHLSDDELAKQIRSDSIDILVDLAGHTAHNRLEVFARKPAPVQVSYLGYPNTTGLQAMDYRLTDAWSDPRGEADARYTETLVRLPAGFLCFRPLGGTVVASLPSAANGFITFGSFNNLSKVTPKVILLWSRLLRKLPGSRLLMKTRPLKDAGTRENIHELFDAQGVARERVELVGWLDRMSDHVGLYSRVDIALDTFPYNGTTTTCEALWMGVPVITLEGATHAGRVGVSLLSMTGLQEFIARDADNYAELVLRLAVDPGKLAQLRYDLRDRLAKSALCDADSFTRHVEAAYREMLNI